MVAIFLLANVVFGGVLLVLWPLVHAWGDWTPLGAFLIGLVALACAFLFTAGALRHVPRWLSW